MIYLELWLAFYEWSLYPFAHRLHLIAEKTLFISYFKTLFLEKNNFFTLAYEFKLYVKAM